MQPLYGACVANQNQVRVGNGQGCFMMTEGVVGLGWFWLVLAAISAPGVFRGTQRLSSTTSGTVFKFTKV